MGAENQVISFKEEAPLEPTEELGGSAAPQGGVKGFLNQYLPQKKHKILAGLGIFLILFIALGAYTTVHALRLKTAATEARTTAAAAVYSLKNQDLVTAKDQLNLTNEHLQTIKSEYGAIGWLNYSPFHWHYQDGVKLLDSAQIAIDSGNTLIVAIEPYADVIGFTGQGSFTGGTAEDRIVKIVETLDKVTPSLEEVTANLEEIDKNISTINPKRYPFINIQGQSVAELISTGQEQLDLATTTLSDLKPILEVLPSVAGVNEQKKYLVMFQNDGELRPTGGFMTAYSVLNVEKGKVSPEKSDDIYELDNKFRERIDAPSMLEEYLNVQYFNLRDMNTDPDFKTSMDRFMGYYQDLPGEPEVDGVIAIDTKLLSDLVTVLGPIDVPGYGTFSAETHPRCDCPEIIYELEEISTRPTPYFRSDRKAILGPMMQTILLKAYGSPKQQWPALFDTIWKSIQEKHVLFYFFDETAQAAVETNNLAGRIHEVQSDYLHINDANLGGAKSNIFVEQEVEQDITLENGTLNKKVTVVYKNPRPGDNCNLEAGQLCLNGRMPSWVRFYIPQNAQVQEVLGLNEGTKNVYQENGKTVVEGVYTLDPQSQVKLTLNYTLEYPDTENYQLLIQKQPGLDNPQHTLIFNGQRQEFELLTDKKISLPL